MRRAVTPAGSRSSFVITPNLRRRAFLKGTLAGLAGGKMLVYYDVGNSNSRGYDVPAEIRFLKDRIACFHFKDRDRYLGEGT